MKEHELCVAFCLRSVFVLRSFIESHTHTRGGLHGLVSRQCVYHCVHTLDTDNNIFLGKHDKIESEKTTGDMKQT